MPKENGNSSTPVATDSNDELLVLPNINVPEGLTSLGRTLVIKGELTAEENLIIEGTVEGHIAVPGHRVAQGSEGLLLIRGISR